MAATSTSPALTLRERKRQRTRAALVAAATELFERDGYEETTVAKIAAAADIGTRTFFGYFASKEELLFPRADDRVAAALEAIRTRRPGERPVDVLVGGLRTLPSAASDDLTGRLALLRLRLIRSVPAVAGRAFARQYAAQREIAAALQEAYPDELDEASAAAVAGAFTGAVASALDVLFGDGEAPPPPDGVRTALIDAVARALGALER